MKRTMAALAISMLLASCGSGSDPASDELENAAEASSENTEAESPADSESAGMANPASTHCVEQGGELEMRESAEGTAGYCVFEDGSECEEWAYFREECAPGGDAPA